MKNRTSALLSLVAPSPSRGAGSRRRAGLVLCPRFARSEGARAGRVRCGEPGGGAGPRTALRPRSSRAARGPVALGGPVADRLEERPDGGGARPVGTPVDRRLRGTRRTSSRHAPPASRKASGPRLSRCRPARSLRRRRRASWSTASRPETACRAPWPFPRTGASTGRSSGASPTAPPRTPSPSPCAPRVRTRFPSRAARPATAAPPPRLSRSRERTASCAGSRPPSGSTPRPATRRSRWDGQPYRGSLAVAVNARGTLNVVNRVDLEEYLYGVVPAEMGPKRFDELEGIEGPGRRRADVRTRSSRAVRGRRATTSARLPSARSTRARPPRIRCRPRRSTRPGASLWASRGDSPTRSSSRRAADVPRTSRTSSGRRPCPTSSRWSAASSRPRLWRGPRSIGARRPGNGRVSNGAAMRSIGISESGVRRAPKCSRSRRAGRECRAPALAAAVLSPGARLSIPADGVRAVRSARGPSASRRSGLLR